MTHTPGHVDCPGCQSRSLVHCEEQLAEQKFRAAFEMWLDARLIGDREETSVRYIAPASEQTYREYAKALEKFFHALKLRDIHDGNLRTYQDDRAANRNGLWSKVCGQNRIKKEVGLLLRMLKAAHLWTEDLDDAFDQLPHKHTDVSRAMDPEQQAHWLASCIWDEEWHWVYHYSRVALQTCASTFELRMGRLIDLSTRHWTLRVGPEASKNKFRNRTIPLESEEVRESAEYLLRRAFDFGCRKPEHYWLPFGAGSRRGDLDVARPMTKYCLKGPWNRVREKSQLFWLRPYDMRHTAITRMAENGIPIATIMAFAGQISPRMQQHYTTISMQAKRQAAQEVWLRKPPTSVLLLPQYASGQCRGIRNRHPMMP